MAIESRGEIHVAIYPSGLCTMSFDEAGRRVNTSSPRACELFLQLLDAFLYKRSSSARTSTALRPLGHASR